MFVNQYDKNSPVSYANGTTLAFELMLNHPDKAKRIYLSPSLKRDETYKKLVNLANSKHIVIIENNEKIFKSPWAKDSTFVISEFEKFETKLPSNGNHVVLVNPSNMGNVGTIMRSCLALGIDGLALIKPCADPFDPKTIRASMGAIFALPIETFSSFEEYQKANLNRSFYPFMLKAETMLGAQKITTPFTLIFGNEATGLNDDFLSLGTPIKIKQSPKADSLNLDNAAAIGIYDFLNH